MVLKCDWIFLYIMWYNISTKTVQEKKKMEINFNLRIDEKLNAELQEIAKEQGRSKNKQIEMILKEYVERYRNAQETRKDT